MGEPFHTALEKASWLRRVLRVSSPQGEYQIAYSGRSLVHERILLNGRLKVQHRIRNWFRPVSRFFVRSRPAAIVLRVWPWLTIRSFHLLIDNQVLYCDRRRDLFEEPQPGIAVVAEPNVSTAFDGPKDPLCPHCDQSLRGVGLDLRSLPASLVPPDGPIGRPTAVFSFASRQRVALMIAGFLAALVGIGLLGALWFVLDERLGMLGFLLLAVGPILVLHARKYRRLQAVAGSEGVALIENDAVATCRWQEIQTVRETLLAGELQSALQASARGEDHFFRVTARDGKDLVFRNFLDNLSWLGEIIQQQTLPYLLPPALTALKNGDVLAFGPLSLHAEGLRSSPERSLSWDEVQDVEIANGLLRVKQTGKWRSWFKTPISQVPNAHVLLALVQHCREATGGVVDRVLEKKYIL